MVKSPLRGCKSGCARQVVKFGGLEMASKLSKEMIERLRGPSAEGGVPSPFRDPALDASIDDARRRNPRTWEEKRAQSMSLHKSRMEEMARKAKGRRQQT